MSLTVGLQLSLFLAIVLSTTALADERAIPHHEIEATFDPSSRVLVVKNRVSFSNWPKGPFRIAEWLSIDDARIGGTPVPAYRKDGLWRIDQKRQPTADLELVLRGEVPKLPKASSRRMVRGAVAGIEAWLRRVAAPMGQPIDNVPPDN